MNGGFNEEETESKTMDPDERRFARLGKKGDKTFEKVEKKIQSWGLAVPAATGSEEDGSDDGESDQEDDDEDDSPSSGDEPELDAAPLRDRRRS